MRIATIFVRCGNRAVSPSFKFHTEFQNSSSGVDESTLRVVWRSQRKSASMPETLMPSPGPDWNWTAISLKFWTLAQSRTLRGSVADTFWRSLMSERRAWIWIVISKRKSASRLLISVNSFGSRKTFALSKWNLYLDIKLIVTSLFNVLFYSQYITVLIYCALKQIHRL